jgi:micrococcal nuclease
MKKILMILLLTLTAIVANAKTNYGAALVSEVVSVYDGDTIKVNVKAWPALIGLNMSIRVNGIDAPEIRGKCLKESAMALQARDFAINFTNSGTVELYNITRGKYFRIAADVMVNGKSLGDELIKANLARPYDGKSARLSWCD